MMFQHVEELKKKKNLRDVLKLGLSHQDMQAELEVYIQNEAKASAKMKVGGNRSAENFKIKQRTMEGIDFL